MSARARKLRSDLFANRTRSILAIVSLAVGTMAVGAMYLAGSSVSSSFQSGFLAANPPSAMLGATPFDAGVVDRVSAHPAVGEAEGRQTVSVRIAAGDARPVGLELVALDTDLGNRVARVVPTDGAWPPEAGALVVERASLPEIGAALGDTVSVELPQQAPVELVVTGTALDIYEVGPMFGGQLRAYVTPQTMAELTGSPQPELDVLYLRAADAPLERESAIAMTSAVRDDVLTPAGVAIEMSEIHEPGVHRADNAISFMVTVLRLMSALALVIAVALVVNTVAAVLAQQRRQLGVMKAVGATSWQLTVQYLGYVLALSVVAIALAVPLALVVGRFVAGFTAGLANFDLEPMGVPWATIGVVVAITIVVPVLAVYVVVRSASRLTVSETITDRGITATARRGRLHLPVGRPTLLAHRNSIRDRARFALTVLTIGACGGVIVGVLNTGDSLAKLSQQVTGYASYDIEVALNRSVPLGHAAAALGDDPAVTEVEGWLRAQAFRLRPDGTENENISLTAAPLDSPSMQPTLVEGRWYTANDDAAIVINTHLVDEEPDLVVGGTIRLDIEGQRRDWNIVGVATTTLVGPVAYLRADQLAAELGRPGETNLLALQIAPGADADAVAERLQTEALGAGLPVSGIQTNAEIRAGVDDLMALVTGALLVVGGVLGVIAVIGVAGTMALGVMEQTREIGVLRTIGASSRAIRRLFVLQGLALASIGCLLGLLAAVPVTAALAAAISRGLIASDLPQGFSWIGVAIWVVVALAIGVLGATRPARTAARLTVRDTLAYE
ncbi:MAG: ABC transporter permease [Ilumatobacter sp.]|nr:MAG: ABC transporter permease [Ilumatobacter sp.]